MVDVISKFVNIFRMTKYGVLSQNNYVGLPSQYWKTIGALTVLYNKLPEHELCFTRLLFPHVFTFSYFLCEL